MLKQICSTILTVIVFYSLFSFEVEAALTINEFSSGTTSDWVEIYNPGPDIIDLGLYILRDSTSSDSNRKELFGNLEAGSFVVIDWSNKLNNGGDVIRLLLKPDESSIENIAYGSEGNDAPMPVNEQTTGRNPDGSANWVILSTSSKGGSNNSSSAVPTSTPIPTSSPTPTKVPTPTKTPTPTKIPASQKSPTLTKLPVQKEEDETQQISNKTTPTTQKAVSVKKQMVAGTEKSVAGVATDNDKEESDDSENIEKTPSYIYSVTTGLGMLALGCGILLYKKYRQKNEEDL